MQRITRQELRNLSNRVLTFYKTRMNISLDIYCVDIEALAKMLGYEIYNVTLGDDAELMGFTAFEPAVLNLEHQNGYTVPISVSANTIVLNDSIKDTCVGRYRFTAAHEVAHLILDMVYHLGYRLRYRSSPKMINNMINYTPFDYEEYIADRLASCILLPEKELRKAFYESFGKNRVEYISPLDCDGGYAKFCRIAERFGVSREALAIRLQQIGMLGKYYNYQQQSALDIFPGVEVS